MGQRYRNRIISATPPTSTNLGVSGVISTDYYAQQKSSGWPTVGVMTVEYLIIGGGGGGGDRFSSSGAGGGGGFINGTTNVTRGASITVTVGAGGATNTKGNDSVFNSLTAYGGFKPVVANMSVTTFGSTGSIVTLQDDALRNLNTSIVNSGNQGNIGGYGYYTGGGGGAGASGGWAYKYSPTPWQYGAGGAGKISDITGSAVYYAGGGGGSGSSSSGYGGAGGVGGGGAGGGIGQASGTSGSTNTGGGGGGGYSSPGSGGSGVVIIKYSDSYPAASTTGSPTYTQITGFRIYKFTGSGSITF